MKRALLFITAIALILTFLSACTKSEKLQTTTEPNESTETFDNGEKYQSELDSGEEVIQSDSDGNKGNKLLGYWKFEYSFYDHNLDINRDFSFIYNFRDDNQIDLYAPDSFANALINPNTLPALGENTMMYYVNDDLTNLRLWSLYNLNDLRMDTAYVQRLDNNYLTIIDSENQCLEFRRLANDKYPLPEWYDMPPSTIVPENSTIFGAWELVYPEIIYGANWKSLTLYFNKNGQVAYIYDQSPRPVGLYSYDESSGRITLFRTLNDSLELTWLDDNAFNIINPDETIPPDMTICTTKHFV